MYIPLSNWTKSPRMISPQGHKKQTYSGQRCSLRCLISTSRTVSQASGGSGLSGGTSASRRADTAADCGAALRR